MNPLGAVGTPLGQDALSYSFPSLSRCPCHDLAFIPLSFPVSDFQGALAGSLKSSADGWCLFPLGLFISKQLPSQSY